MTVILQWFQRMNGGYPSAVSRYILPGLAANLMFAGCSSGTGSKSRQAPEAPHPVVQSPAPKLQNSDSTQLLTLEAAYAKSPADPKTAIRYARAAVNAEPAKAAKALRAVLKADGMNSEARELLGQLYQSTGYLDRYIELLEEGVKLKPEIRSLCQLARMYQTIHDDSGAMRLLDDAIKISPQSRDVLETRLFFAYNLRKQSEGIPLLLDLIMQYPKEFKLWYRLSEFYRSIGEIRKAEESIKQALISDPLDYANHRQYAHILLSQENPTRWPEAELSARKAVEMQPGDLDANYWLAIAFDKQKKVPDAIRYFERTRNIDPAYETTTFRLGKLYQQSGRFDEGNALLTEYSEMEANRSTLALAIGQYKKNPANAKAAVHVANLYSKANQHGIAVAMMRHGLISHPGDLLMQAQLRTSLQIAGRLTEAKAASKAGN